MCPRRFAIVFLYLTLLSALSGCSFDINYSDKAMIRHFQKNEQLFNELATSALRANDLRILRSCDGPPCYRNRATETYYAILEDGERVETGFGNLSEIMNTLDLASLDIEHGGYKKEVYMRRSKRREMTLFDPESSYAVKGYLYSTEPVDPNRLEDKLESSSLYNNDLRFRHIAGSWYLYISIDVS